jgi:MFS family permease
LNERVKPGKKSGLVPSVLKNKNFARLFFAGVTSASGFAIGQVALTYVVFADTRSPLDVAYIGVSFIVATILFSLVAGALVDRHERRKLMVLSDLARAASLVALVISMLLIGFNLAVVLAVAFVLGSFTTLFQPAERALTPAVVGTEQLQTANALVQATNSIIQFASITSGGVLIFAVGVIVAFALNTSTFIVSALLIAGIVGFSVPKRGGPEEGQAARPSIFDDAKEGFRYILRNRALLELTVSSGLANLFLVMVFQFYVFYAYDVLHGGVTVYALLSGLFPLGVAPGAYVSARFNAVRSAGWVFIFSGVAEGVVALGLVALPYLATSLVIVFMLGFFLGLLNTTWLNTVQLIVPTEMQGRYFGLDQLGSTAVIPVGQVLGGVLISVSGILTDYTVAGVGIILSIGLFVFSPYLRTLRWTGNSGKQSAGGGTFARPTE